MTDARAAVYHRTGICPDPIKCRILLLRIGRAGAGRFVITFEKIRPAGRAAKVGERRVRNNIIYSDIDTNAPGE